MFQASDADNETLTFLLTPPQTQFSVINQNNIATITLIQPLDFETKSFYDFNVTAIDGAERKAVVNLKINISNVDENQVVFSKSLYEFYISEASDLDFPFGLLEVIDADSNPSVTFVSNSTLFAAEKSSLRTAILVVQNELDRETQASYSFDVSAQEGGVTARTRVIVHLTDVNDVAPQFQQQNLNFYYQSFPESLVAGIRIFIPFPYNQIIDPDLISNPYFEFNPPQEDFNLNNRTGAISIKNIDRERKDFYTFELVYTDGLFTTRQEFNLTITDINDERPVFTNFQPSISLLENTTTPSEIIQFQATDADTLPNGIIRFKISGIDDELTYFGLDSITGKLTLQKPLDFEGQRLYSLFISAYNVDQNGLTVPNTENEAQKFEINVLDVNDVLPAFIKSEYRIQIRDSSPIGMQILTLSVTDLDGPEDFVYTIVEGNVDELYQINPSTGVLEIAKSLKDSGNVTLNVSVTNNGGLDEDICQVHLVLTKDAASIFSQAQYSISIQEGAAPQVLVNLNISITDPGIEISFEDPTHNELFEINKLTGDVSTKSPLNYEDAPEYNLVIKATDGQFISTVIVIVSVIDLDDEQPTITSELTATFSVQENAPVGTIVGYIEATDPDSPNLIFTISTVPPTIPPPDLARRRRAVTPLPFEMLSSNGTGFLVVTSALDASVQSLYQIYITVADSSGNTFPDPVQRSIVVVDINDNAPKFNQTEYRFSVPEDTPIGTSIGQLFASDVDVNATLTYSAPGDQQKFRVTNQSDIVVESQLDFETRRTVRFVVLVSDGTLIGITNVIVDILPVFEHKPIFEGPFEYNLKENTPVGQLFQVDAKSADQCLDPCQMSYEIASQKVFNRGGDVANVADFLQIQASDGAVTLLRSLDALYSKIEIEVKASWGITWNSTVIIVNIQDINNNPPEFLGEPYFASITEDSAIGTTHAL